MKPFAIMRFFYLFIFCLILNSHSQLLYAQNVKDSLLIREQHPFALKIGLEGFGIDYSIGRYVAIDAATLLFINNARLRFFLFEKNSTPFVGIGTESIAWFDDQSWIGIHLGWEVAYKHLLLQISMQHQFFRHGKEYASGSFLIPGFYIGYCF